MRKKQLKVKRKGKKMSELEVKNEDVALSKRDLKNAGVLEIRGEQGSTGKLEIFFRHPVLAEVISKMSMGNYPMADFDKVYAPCLLEYPDPRAKGRAVSRPAIYAATKNIEGATDFDFTKPPRGVLVSNPEALRQGFSLIINIKQPVPNDTLRKWGKQLMDGCADIIAASKPFRMQWVMTETEPGKL
jgi:hypothetical protein